MMLPITLILVSVASFVSATQNTCPLSTSQVCSTVMATVPNWWWVPTVTKTTTLAALTNTGTTTVYTTQTVAAAPVTATTTAVTTSVLTSTATPGTNTVYATYTSVVTNAATTTTVTTGTSTVITSTTVVQWSTASVPTPTGFIPVFSSSGDHTYASKRKTRRGGLAARLNDLKLDERGIVTDLLAALLKSKYNLVTGQVPDKSRASFDPLKWSNPVAVNCVKVVTPVCNKGITITSTITSTGAPATVTSTVLTTTTSTQIIVPPSVTATVNTATVTSTTTTSLLVTSSATATTTLTNTNIVVSTTTLYAACATVNVLGPNIAANEALTQVLFYDSNAVVATSSQTSAVNCCAACQTGSNCQFYQYTGSDGTCWVVGGDANWCPNSQQDNTPGYFVWKDPSQTTQALTVGNGPCGTLMDAGQAQ